MGKKIYIHLKLAKFIRFKIQMEIKKERKKNMGQAQGKRNGYGFLSRVQQLKLEAH